MNLEGSSKVQPQLSPSWCHKGKSRWLRSSISLVTQRGSFPILVILVLVSQHGSILICFLQLWNPHEPCPAQSVATRDNLNWTVRHGRHSHWAMLPESELNTFCLRHAIRHSASELFSAKAQKCDCMKQRKSWQSTWAEVSSKQWCSSDNDPKQRVRRSVMAVLTPWQ